MSNKYHDAFIDIARQLAFNKGLAWNPPSDERGKIIKDKRWNLTALTQMVPPPIIWLSDFGFDRASLEALNNLQMHTGKKPKPFGSLSLAWRDLYQAVILTELLVKRNKPSHAILNVGRPIKILATCADTSDPWKLSANEVQLAYNVSLNIGNSGKIANNFAMMMRTIFDKQHLADRGLLERFCVPYSTEDARNNYARAVTLQRSENSNGCLDKIRQSLHERKHAEKLPTKRAFWELARIVFTMKPQTFSDAIRFAQIKIAILTGFRIGENAMLPLDWERWREYLDLKGRPLGKSGGISRSLMIRYFAEKQFEDEGAEGVVLYENSQHVPAMYEKSILKILRDTARITAPMRERLRQQTETGRLLPEFPQDALVGAADMYIRISGSMSLVDEPLPKELVDRYQQTFDPRVLDEIRNHQLQRVEEIPDIAVRKYWHHHIKHGRIIIRQANGDPFKGRISWQDAYFRVGEIEDMIRLHMPTKMPDIKPFILANGNKLWPWELMFLMPIRALAENRNSGLTDVSRYFSNGRVSTYDMQVHMGSKDNNLFSRYGESAEDQALTLEPHALRHLLNTELFRLGVADAIITHHFGRTNPAQSKVYDHRCLAEDLAYIDLPDDIEESMGPRAQEVLKMIMAKKVSGPIVDEFLRIQREQGDNAAFLYLDAEADGFHVTPYGFCLNSFTVEPSGTFSKAFGKFFCQFLY